MGYNVKWVEENLGVSRKALRIYEDKELMPKNKNRAHRNYSDEDIDRIWGIRLLQGIGFKLNEIQAIYQDEDFEFDKAIEKKIEELELEQERIKQHLGYARCIKFTGRIPYGIAKMGNIKADEFRDVALREWNINKDEDAKRFYDIAQVYLNAPEEELKDTDLGRMIEYFQELDQMIKNKEIILIEKILPLEIIRRKAVGATHPEVQLLVKIIYDNRINSGIGLEGMTKNQFVRLESSNYLYGDIARIKHQELGKENCEFIANAIAVFGGFNCYDEIE